MSRKEKRTITVVLGLNDYDRFDAYCSERGFKKSTLIVRLMREHLDAQGYAAQLALPTDETRRRPRRSPVERARKKER